MPPAQNPSFVMIGCQKTVLLCNIQYYCSNMQPWEGGSETTMLGRTGHPNHAKKCGCIFSIHWQLKSQTNHASRCPDVWDWATNNSTNCCLETGASDASNGRMRCIVVDDVGWLCCQQSNIRANNAGWWHWNECCHNAEWRTWQKFGCPVNTAKKKQCYPRKHHKQGFFGLTGCPGSATQRKVDPRSMYVCMYVWTQPPVGVGCLIYVVSTARLIHPPTMPVRSYPLGLRTSVSPWAGENINWQLSLGNVDRTVTANL